MHSIRRFTLCALFVFSGAACAQNGQPEVFNSPVAKGTMSEYIRHSFTRVCFRAPQSSLTECSKQAYTLTLKSGAGKDTVYALDLGKAKPKDGQKLLVTEIHEIDVPQGGDVTMHILVMFNPADGSVADSRGHPVLYRAIYDAALKPVVPVSSGAEAERFLDKARRNPETRIFRVIDAL
jgi:hypothetical protein